MYILSKFLLSLVIYQLVTSSVNAIPEPDLYTDNDAVIRLNATSFIPTVFHQNKNVTYMVQFYNTFCGHCQMFAPIYKELALRVQNWTTVFRMAGVDCAKDENLLTCRDNNIGGYPTILIFAPNSKAQDSKDAPFNLRNLNINWNVDEIEESIVDYMTNLTQIKPEVPLVVLALQPITESDPSRIQRIYSHPDLRNDLDDRDSDIQDMMLVIEGPKSYVGRKLILEYYRLHKKLELRRTTTANTGLMSHILFEKDLTNLDKNLPILVRLKSHRIGDSDILVKGEEQTILPSKTQSERQDEVYNRFKAFFEHYYFVELGKIDTSVVKSAYGEKDRPQNSNGDRVEETEIQYLIHNDPIGSNKIFAIDILKAVAYMLTHEVRIKGDLNPSEYKTVRDLLTVIKKFLPLDKWDKQFMKFVDTLRTKFDVDRDTYEKDGMGADVVKTIMDEANADSISKAYHDANYVSCWNSDRNHKGYTCSVWLLFHSLTVGEYYKTAPVIREPKLVLTTMRDYITQFLGCTVCATNFAKETENMLNSITAKNSSVMWLWRTHNQISERINNEKETEIKPLIEIIFPAHNKCPRCIATQISEVGVDGKTLTDVVWNLPAVFDYVCALYKPENVVSPDAMNRMLSTIKSKLNYDVIETNATQEQRRPITFSSDSLNQSIEQSNSHTMFTTSDISFCLIIYASCIFIVVTVFFALKPRWKRFKTR